MRNSAFLSNKLMLNTINFHQNSLQNPDNRTQPFWTWLISPPQWNQSTELPNGGGSRWGYRGLRCAGNLQFGLQGTVHQWRIHKCSRSLWIRSQHGRSLSPSGQHKGECSWKTMKHEFAFLMSSLNRTARKGTWGLHQDLQQGKTSWGSGIPDT